MADVDAALLPPAAAARFSVYADEDEDEEGSMICPECTKPCCPGGDEKIITCEGCDLYYHLACSRVRPPQVDESAPPPAPGFCFRCSLELQAKRLQQRLRLHSSRQRHLSEPASPDRKHALEESPHGSRRRKRSRLNSRAWSSTRRLVDAAGGAGGASAAAAAPAAGDTAGAGAGTPLFPHSATDTPSSSNSSAHVAAGGGSSSAAASFFAQRIRSNTWHGRGPRSPSDSPPSAMVAAAAPAAMAAAEAMAVLTGPITHQQHLAGSRGSAGAAPADSSTLSQLPPRRRNPPADKCPNAWNLWHECSTFCFWMWSVGNRRLADFYGKVPVIVEEDEEDDDEEEEDAVEQAVFGGRSSKGGAAVFNPRRGRTRAITVIGPMPRAQRQRQRSESAVAGGAGAAVGGVAAATAANGSAAAGGRRRTSSVSSSSLSGSKGSNGAAGGAPPPAAAGAVSGLGSRRRTTSASSEPGEHRRVFHNERERMRRSTIRNLFDSLRRCVPSLSFQDAVSDREILICAARHIKELVDQADELDVELRAQRMRNLRLRLQQKHGGRFWGVCVGGGRGCSGCCCVGLIKRFG